MQNKFRKVYHTPKKRESGGGPPPYSLSSTTWQYSFRSPILETLLVPGRWKREPELVKEYENHYCELFYRTIMNDPLQDVEHHRRILAKAFRLIIDQISEEERDNFIPLIVSSLNCRVFVVCNLNIIYVIFIPRVIFKS